MEEGLLLRKLGLNEASTDDHSYNDWARTAVVDWGPDEEYLEEHKDRRQSDNARRVLARHYDSDPLPENPEFFYGFLDEDNRGPDGNPRMDQMYTQINSRNSETTASMGKNADYHEGERPWTEQSLLQMREGVYGALKSNSRDFSDHIAGGFSNQNISANEYTSARLHNSKNEFQSDSAICDGVRAGSHAQIDAPWRHHIQDGVLAVQDYSQIRGSGHCNFDPSAVRAQQTQAFEESLQNRNANNVLIAAMISSVQSAEYDQQLAQSIEGVVRGGGVPVSNFDPHLSRPTGDFSEHLEGRRNTALYPSRDPSAISRFTQKSMVENEHLITAMAIGRGLREGTAAAKRRIAKYIVADGVRSSANAQQNNYSGTAPKTTQQINLVRAHIDHDAGNNVQVNNYSGVASKFEQKIQNNKYDTDWQVQQLTPLKKSSLPERIPLYNSTVDQRTSSSHETFVSSAGHSGAKRLRADPNSISSKLNEHFS